MASRSADEALGVTFTRCGNRRADKCESCSRLYAADTFQLIRAGVAGGRSAGRGGRGTPPRGGRRAARQVGLAHDVARGLRHLNLGRLKSIAGPEHTRVDYQIGEVFGRGDGLDGRDPTIQVVAFPLAQAAILPIAPGDPFDVVHVG